MIMNLKLLVCQLYIPGFYKRAKLARLFQITAQAFTGNEIRPAAKRFDTLLTDYAVFTREQAAKALEKSVSLETIKFHLFNSACQMGTELRQELAIKNHRDFRIAARAIYKTLKIDFLCHHTGEFTITKCFFSNFYSGAVCAIMSSLDCGLIAGLSNGLRMNFAQRITENCPCCKGRISS
jgi:hypothetical protein